MGSVTQEASTILEWEIDGSDGDALTRDVDCTGQDLEEGTMAARGIHIESLVLAMRGVVGNLDSQLAGCRILAGILRNADEFTVRIVVAIGGIEAVISTMYHYYEVEEVQSFGCCSLFMLLSRDITLIKEVADHGGIKVVISAMRSHGTSLEVQSLALCVLYLLSASDHNKTEIVDLEGIETVISAMFVHIGSEKLQRQGSLILRGLSCVVRSSAPVRTSSTSPQNSLIREPSDFFMGYGTRIVHAGGIEALLSAMIVHVDREEVQEAACGALCNLSFDADHADKIAKTSGVAAMLTAIRRHEENDEVFITAFTGSANVVRSCANTAVTAMRQAMVMLECLLDVMLKSKLPRKDRLHTMGLHMLSVDIFRGFVHDIHKEMTDFKSRIARFNIILAAVERGQLATIFANESFEVFSKFVDPCNYTESYQSK